MSQRMFTCEELAHYADGQLSQDFNTQLSAAVKDCVDRPSIKNKREVKIVVTIEPHLNVDGTCDDVYVHVEVAGKTPAKSVPDYRMTATAKGGLKYEPLSPGNPNQPGLDFDKE